MHRALACLFVAVALGTPAWAADAPDFKATAHRIAVVSLLGDELNVGPSSATPIPGAGFDALVEAAIAKQIAADLPGATVSAVDALRAELLTQMYPQAGFGDAGMGNVRLALRLWAAEHPNDYIVVFRKTAGDPFPAVHDKIPFFGIGLANKNSEAVVNQLTPAALLNVTVLDGASLEVVADLSARDTDWSQHNFARGEPEARWLPILVDDTKAMLDSIAPALVHGVGL
jgi:hypothetical protein